MTTNAERSHVDSPPRSCTAINLHDKDLTKQQGLRTLSRSAMQLLYHIKFPRMGSVKLKISTYVDAGFCRYVPVWPCRYEPLCRKTLPRRHTMNVAVPQLTNKNPPARDPPRIIRQLWRLNPALGEGLNGHDNN